MDISQITVPTLSDIIVPDLPEFVPPTPPPAAAPPVVTFLYEAYGTIVQDFIDGKITDFSKWYVTVASVFKELRGVNHAVSRKYDTKRRDIMREEGARNLPGLPGSLAKKLNDLSIDERRELSEEALKVVAEAVTKSHDSIKSVTELAITFEAVRFDTHHKMQAATFEVASAAAHAAIATAVENTKRAEVDIEVIIAEAQKQAIQLEALAQKAEMVAEEARLAAARAEYAAVLAEFAIIPARMAEIAAKQKALLANIAVLNAEILKNQAQLELAQAELLVARQKEITATYEIQKAQARMGLASSMRAKTDAEVERAKALVERAAANDAMDRATLSLEVKREELRQVEEEFEVTKTEFRAAMTALRKAIPEAEKQIREMRKEQINAQSDAETNRRNTITIKKFVAIIKRAEWLFNATMGPDNQMTALAQRSIGYASEKKCKAISDAAHAAANADVSSDFYYYKGEG